MAANVMIRRFQFSVLSIFYNYNSQTKLPGIF